jgi:hypothetical protein
MVDPVGSLSLTICLQQHLITILSSVVPVAYPVTAGLAGESAYLASERKSNQRHPGSA